MHRPVLPAHPRVSPGHWSLEHQYICLADAIAYGYYLPVGVGKRLIGCTCGVAHLASCGLGVCPGVGEFCLEVSDARLSALRVRPQPRALLLGLRAVETLGFRAR